MSGMSGANHEVTPQSPLEARTADPTLDFEGGRRPSQAWLSRGSASQIAPCPYSEEAADRLGVGRTVMHVGRFGRR